MVRIGFDLAEAKPIQIRPQSQRKHPSGRLQLLSKSNRFDSLDEASMKPRRSLDEFFNTRLSIAGGPPFAPKAAPGCTWTLPAAPCSKFFLRLRIWLAAAGWWVGWQLLWLVNMQTHVHTCTCFCYVFPMAPACTLSAPASIVAQTYRFFICFIANPKGGTRLHPVGTRWKLAKTICFYMFQRNRIFHPISFI